MRSTSTVLALALAASMPLQGCTTTHLAGEYRTKSNDLVRKEKKRTLAKGSNWLFFWGLLDTGHFDLQGKLSDQLRGDEVVTDLEVKDRLSVGGFFLFIITAGIVSHHALVAKGSPAISNRPPAEKGTATAPSPAPVRSTCPCASRSTLLIRSPTRCLDDPEPRAIRRSGATSTGWRPRVSRHPRAPASDPR